MPKKCAQQNVFLTYDCVCQSPMCEGFIRQYYVHDWKKYDCLDMVDSKYTGQLFCMQQLLYNERFMPHIDTFKAKLYYNETN